MPRAPKLKQSYSAREVAALTGLTARQLQWWDSRQLLSASVASLRCACELWLPRRLANPTTMATMMTAKISEFARKKNAAPTWLTPKSTASAC